MSHYENDYARIWYINNPLTSETVSFLAVSTNRIWNANVNSHPKLNASTRKDLRCAIRNFRAINKAILDLNHSQIVESLKALVKRGSSTYGNIWSNCEVFSQYYESWETIIKKLNLPIRTPYDLIYDNQMDDIGYHHGREPKEDSNLKEVMECSKGGGSDLGKEVKASLVSGDASLHGRGATSTDCRVDLAIRGMSTIRYKDFDLNLNRVGDLDPSHKAIFEVIPPPYMSVINDEPVIRKGDPSVVNVRGFIKENNLDETDLDDVSFSAIVVILASSGAITANTDSPIPSLANINENSRVTEIKLKSWSKAARRMVDAAFAFSSQGVKNGELSWYDSFTAVYGKIMSARRFIRVCELIMISGYLESYTKLTDIGTILSAHNVIGYRLNRLSSPALILEAFKLADSELIYRMVDPDELRDYVQFHRGGILAQIAAGPLKGYCRGDIDVLTTTGIPSDIKIIELKAIDIAPYHERILRQAYIILEIYGKLPVGWYQGEKARQGTDGKDIIFEAIIKAYKDSMVDAAGELLKNVGETRIDSFIGEASVYDEIKSLLSIGGRTN